MTDPIETPTLSKLPERDQDKLILVGLQIAENKARWVTLPLSSKLWYLTRCLGESIYYEGIVRWWDPDRYLARRKVISFAREISPMDERYRSVAREVVERNLQSSGE